MICKHCGSEVKQKAEKDPWCMYKLHKGEVISQLFNPDKIPKGWYDSPRKAKAKKQSKLYTNKLSDEANITINHAEAEISDGDSARIN